MNIIKFSDNLLNNSLLINKLIKKLDEKYKKKNIIVVPAIKGITNKLIKCGEKAKNKDKNLKKLINEIKNIHLNIIKDVIPLTKQSSVISFLIKKINILKNLCESVLELEELTKQSIDKIISLGEIISSYIIYKKLKLIENNTYWKNSNELIVTNDNFGSAEIIFDITSCNIKKYFNNKKFKYVIIPGFLGLSIKKKLITTLGRGGSYYTSIIIASILKNPLVRIWTNKMNQITSADPKIVNKALPIENISYDEALELSHFGVKNINIKAIELAKKNSIKIEILDFLKSRKNIISISNIKYNNNKNPVTSICGIKKIILITIEGKNSKTIQKYYKKLFDYLSYKEIKVILITQGYSENVITIGIKKNDLIKTKLSIKKILYKEIDKKKINILNIEENLSIISIIGDNMKNFYGTSGKIFSTLGKNSINIRAITQNSTEKNISSVIKENDFKKAINTLHEIFFESPEKEINLFIIGLGNVGSKLIEQIIKQKKYLKKILKLNLKINGLANSKNMIFDKKGIKIKDWKKLIKKGNKTIISEFIKKTIKFNLRNSLFVDNTSNKNIAMSYDKFLQKCIGVITCNKIACSSNYNYYKKLKNLSYSFNAPFLFETNVGAGLPIISTLNDLINSGDRINKIEAVLSGSLNFIFNNFNGEKKFLDVVKKAKEKGYTEPDPRIDLSGIDVIRKIIILARESGSEIEIKDIKQKHFIPKEFFKTKNLELFYNKLSHYEYVIKKIYKKSKNEKKKLKYIAKYENGKAYVKLESIGTDHPFYNLEGKDNMVSYLTSRYKEQPLVIKGAGAGSEVTASGVLSDIIKASR